MYPPKVFQQTDCDELKRLIHDYPLATLMVQGESQPNAFHIPFIYQQEGAGKGVLQAHIPRFSPLFSDGLTGDCLAIFHGPNGYISPSWYATKQEHGKAVPTWNYAVVHARGKLRIIDDVEWVRDQIERLTAQHENHREKPWSMDDAPADYTAKMLTALVGVEIAIEEVTGTFKLSQNQPQRNHQPVLYALKDDPSSAALFQIMHHHLIGK